MTFDFSIINNINVWLPDLMPRKVMHTIIENRHRWDTNRLAATGGSEARGILIAAGFGLSSRELRFYIHQYIVHPANSNILVLDLFNYDIYVPRYQPTEEEL